MSVKWISPCQKFPIYRPKCFSSRRTWPCSIELVRGITVDIIESGLKLQLTLVTLMMTEEVCVSKLSLAIRVQEFENEKCSNSWSPLIIAWTQSFYINQPLSYLSKMVSVTYGETTTGREKVSWTNFVIGGWLNRGFLTCFSLHTRWTRQLETYDLSGTSYLRLTLTLLSFVVKNNSVSTIFLKKFRFRM